MLQSALRQGVRGVRVAPLAEGCVACQCACGRVFAPTLAHIQKRGAKHRKSPTVQKMQSAKNNAKSAGVKPLAQRLAEFDERAASHAIVEATSAGEMYGDLVAPFLKAFTTRMSEPSLRASLHIAGRGPAGSSSIVDPQWLRDQQRAMGLDDMEMTNIAISMRWVGDDDDYVIVGTALLYSLANIGNEWAMICIMDTALDIKAKVPDALKMQETVKVRKRLEEIAWTGQNFRVSALAGKIAYDEGQRGKAVEFWKKALRGAVAASEANRRAKLRDGALHQEEHLHGASLADLSAPWVELTTHYINHRDFTNARWAIDIGCEQDDPNSHFAASMLERKGPDGNSSGWFYHITKAATSGHVRSMHELGLWYAQDGWPYFEDEPPDDIKPTPFDRYPPQTIRGNLGGSSPRQRLLAALGFKPQVKESTDAQTFQAAAFPNSHVERFAMALQWLEVAMGYHYGPSFLAAAELLLYENLYFEAATPREALELSDSRYTYASKQDYLDGKPIERPKETHRKEIANPYYDPTKAKSLTLEIFYAHAALEMRLHQIRSKIQRNININQQADPTAQKAWEESFSADVGTNLRKWFTYPEVRELFMNDQTGKLIDRERNNIDLLEEAKALCEDQGWDIYGEDGSLMYRSGLRNKPIQMRGNRQG